MMAVRTIALQDGADMHTRGERCCTDLDFQEHIHTCPDGCGQIELHGEQPVWDIRGQRARIPEHRVLIITCVSIIPYFDGRCQGPKGRCSKKIVSAA